MVQKWKVEGQTSDTASEQKSKTQAMEEWQRVQYQLSLVLPLQPRFKEVHEAGRDERLIIRVQEVREENYKSEFEGHPLCCGWGQLYINIEVKIHMYVVSESLQYMILLENSII